MDNVIRQFSYGEIGFDTEHSPGNGPYYMIHYRSGATICGFDSENEALDELHCFLDVYEHAEVE
jgi:hypothetical protein